MSFTRPEEAHHIKKNAYCQLKGFPCKIVEVKTSKTGKHGHAKCNITGIDVLTGKKYNEVHPGHIILAAFDLVKNEYEVSLVEEGEGGAVEVTYMDENSAEQKLTIPDREDKTGAKLLADYSDPANAEKFYVITVTNAPVGEGDKCHLESAVLEYKEGKD